MDEDVILVVDDDPQIRDVLRIALGRAGFDARFARNGVEGEQAVRQSLPDLVILDIGMPEKDGLEMCRSLRAESDVPVIFLTARDDEVDKIVGLELGADDYMTKPFSPRELIARIRAILKRSRGGGRGGGAPSLSLRHGTLALWPKAHRCEASGVAVALTATEIAILARLMAHPEQVISRPRLVDAVWGAGVPVSDRTLDSHLRNLRAKLSAAGVSDAIETLHGVGLRMGPCTSA